MENYMYNIIVYMAYVLFQCALCQVLIVEGIDFWHTKSSRPHPLCAIPVVQPTDMMGKTKVSRSKASEGSSSKVMKKIAEI